MVEPTQIKLVYNIMVINGYDIIKLSYTYYRHVKFLHDG